MYIYLVVVLILRTAPCHELVALSESSTLNFSIKLL